MYVCAKTSTSYYQSRWLRRWWWWWFFVLFFFSTGANLIRTVQERPPCFISPLHPISAVVIGISVRFSSLTSQKIYIIWWSRWNHLSGHKPAHTKYNAQKTMEKCNFWRETLEAAPMKKKKSQKHSFDVLKKMFLNIARFFHFLCSIIQQSCKSVEEEVKYKVYIYFSNLCYFDWARSLFILFCRRICL